MKNTAWMHLLLAISLLTGCGGNSGGGSDFVGGGSATTATSNPSQASDGRILLPAMSLSGATSSVGLQPTGGATSTVLAIDGTQWTPNCATGAGITYASNQSSFSVDQACLASLSVFEVSSVALGGVESKAKFHGVFTAEQVKSGDAAITVLTELAYAQVHVLLAARRPAAEVLAKLDAVASWLLASDLNNDGVINYADLVAWRPADGDAGLRIRTADINNLYLSQTDAGLSALEAVNAVTVVKAVAETFGRAVVNTVADDADSKPLLVKRVTTASGMLFYVLSDGSIAATSLSGTLLWNKTISNSSLAVTVTALDASEDYLVTAGCVDVQPAAVCNTLSVAAMISSGTPDFNSLDLGVRILSVKIDAGTALVTTVNGLVVVDLSSVSIVPNGGQSNPVVPSTLVVTEDYLYAVASNKLSILDRTTREEVGSLTLNHNFSAVSDAVLINHHLVVAAGLAGILNIDVTDPAEPVEGNTIVGATANEKTTSLAVINAEIVSLSSSGLRAFTLSESGELQPTARQFIRNVYPDGGMAVTDSALFFATGSGNSIASASPDLLVANSIAIAQLPIAGASTMTQQDSALFVGASPSSNIEDSAGKLVKVDIANPLVPTISREYPVSGGVNAISVHGQRAGVANPPSGYGVIDLESGNFLSRDGDIPGTAVGITPNDIYDIVHNRNGLVLFNTNDAAAPVAVFEPANLTDSWAGVIKDSTLLQAQGSSGLGILSIENAGVASVKTLSTEDDAGWSGTLQSWSVALDGNTLYSAGCAALSVLDVTSPTAPKVINQSAATPCVKQVAISSNIAYAVDFDGTISVFDVAVPSQPVFVGLLPITAPANYILANGSNVFVLEESRVLSVLNGLKSLPLSRIN